MANEMVEKVARALMAVTAKLPGQPDGIARPVLASDPDFDDLPLDASQGTKDDDLTQEAVMRLARAAIAAMREPTPTMISANITNRYDDRFESMEEGLEGEWQAMIDEALRDP